MRKASLAMLVSLVGTLGGAGKAAAGGGTIKGVVTVTGKVPAPKDINMKSDPFCAKQPAAKDDEIVAGAGGVLKNAVVRIAKGAVTTAAAPSTPAVMDQTGCSYHPRVVVVQAGQPVEIRNSDQTLHNVHTYKGQSTLFNLAQPGGLPPIKKKLTATVGDVVRFKCDVHPWMTGYLLVTDNPHFAVTGAAGNFELKDVPAGKYTVEIWHEKLGTQTKEITVADGKANELKIELPAP